MGHNVLYTNLSHLKPFHMLCSLNSFSNSGTTSLFGLEGSVIHAEIIISMRLNMTSCSSIYSFSVFLFNKTSFPIMWFITVLVHAIIHMFLWVITELIVWDDVHTAIPSHIPLRLYLDLTMNFIVKKIIGFEVMFWWETQIRP